MFEMRLQGGFRMFWSTITPTVCGHLHTIAAPGFCRDVGLLRHCGDRMPGIWDLWPIDNPSRPHPFDESDRLCRPVNLTGRTPGIALISFQQEHGPGSLWVELFLSATEPGHNGRSVFEDWAEILSTAKDDIYKDAVLRLNAGIVTPDEIAGFKSQKKLVTADLTLEVRPRTF